jgi:hypothetical protein
VKTAASASEGVRRNRELEDVAAKGLEAVDVLADVWGVFATIDGIGTGAVPAKAAVLVALEGNLIDLSTAEDLPEHGAPDLAGVKATVGKAEAVRARMPLTARPRQGREQQRLGHEIRKIFERTHRRFGSRALLNPSKVF